ANVPDPRNEGEVWQTVMNVRAMVALSDRLDKSTRDEARLYVDKALRAIADQAEFKPDRLSMVAQIMRYAIGYVNSSTIIYLREKIGTAFDKAFANGDARAQSGLAIGVAALAVLPPDSQKRNWAAFDSLVKFVIDPTASFRAALAARQIGPLI